MTLLAIVGLVAAAIVGARAAKAEAELRGKVDELEAWAADAETKHRAQVDDLERRLSEAEKDQGIDRPPCLGRALGGRVHPLFRVMVNRGYRLEQLWLPKDARERAAVPSFLTEQPAEELSGAQFLDRAKMIHDFGDREDTFGRRCRFYVELKRGPSISFADYRAADDRVSGYFFYSNASEVRKERAQGL